MTSSRRSPSRLARAAGGRLAACFVALAALFALLANGPRPPLGSGGPASADPATIMAGPLGISEQALTPHLPTEGLASRVVRTGAARASGGAPPGDAAALAPGTADTDTPLSGASPVIGRPDRGAPHPRLVATPRAPTGPPVQRI